MIERRTRPGGRGMARRAGGREELRLRCVAWIGGVVVIGLMAADTSRGQRRVVAVDVAVGAYPRRHYVRAGQREGGVVVIKRGIGPVRRVVTKFARSGEASRCVGRVGCAGVILLVARVAQSAIQ